MSTKRRFSDDYVGKVLKKQKNPIQVYEVVNYSNEPFYCSSNARAVVAGNTDSFKDPLCQYMFRKPVELFHKVAKDFFVFYLYTAEKLTEEKFPALYRCLYNADLQSCIKGQDFLRDCKRIHLPSSRGSESILERYFEKMIGPFYLFFDNVTVSVDDSSGILHNFSGLEDVVHRFLESDSLVHVRIKFLCTEYKRMEEPYFTLCYNIDSPLAMRNLDAYRDYHLGKTVVSLSSLREGKLVNVSIVS